MSQPKALAQHLPNPVPLTEEAFGKGFHAREHDGADGFRWMGRLAELVLVADGRPRFVELEVLSEFFDLGQELRAHCGDAESVLSLPHGWARVSLPLPGGADRVVLAVDRELPASLHPGDERELTVRVRRGVLHEDDERHALVTQQHANIVLNQQEMLEGRLVLESTPPSLGIDLYGECNVKPPCVYCEWDAMKRLEGEAAERTFDLGTLAEYGPFYAQAQQLVNCSIGEPFMMRQLDELLDAFATAGKTLEMSTNGQILTDRNISRLVGRDIHLYVSLDAASAETYAKLRNRRFPAILDNLRRLVAAKGGRGHPPLLYLVFMPMRVNVHELDDFVQLAADLEADQLVLRPLNDAPDIELHWERGGHQFDYQRQRLSFDTLIRVAGRAHELCRRLGVPLANQLDFGGATQDKFQRLFDEGRRLAPAAQEPAPQAPAPEPVKPAPRPPEEKHSPEAAQPAPEPPPASLPTLGRERWPVCTEPWRNLYILRRGVLPCCYGGDPLADMDGFREAWNGPVLQDIRRALARGRFADYCLRNPSCPLVRKSEEARELPLAHALLLPARRAWNGLNRRTWGVPRLLVAPFKWVVLRMVRAVREPRWLIGAAKRRLGLEHPQPPNTSA